MTPEIAPFHHADTGTWSYVVADPTQRAAAIIDPVLDFDPRSGRTSRTSADALVAHVRERGWRLEWILETHAHADHLTAAPAVREGLGGRVAIGSGIRSVQAHFAQVFNLGPEFARDGSQFDHLFEGDARFRIGGIEARAIPVPGHTADSLAYLIGDALFTGDSLFMPDAGTARCDFPGGDAATLFRSIQRLYQLPATTRVFVCHDYGPDGREPRCETTIGDQRAHNIHVRTDSREEDFVRVREARDATLALPTLILPSLQVNLRAGAMPPAEDNGVSYLKLPIDLL